MMRLIDGEFVRICSYAFPSDSPLPQLSKSLPQDLRREMASLEVDADDLVTLRFHLRSRIACIQTRDGAIAWQASGPCKLHVSYRNEVLQPLRDGKPAEKAAPTPEWEAVSPERTGAMDTKGSLVGGEQEEHGLSQDILAQPVLDGEFSSSLGVQNSDPAHLHFQNGANGDVAGIGPQETDANSAGGMAQRGYVRLELLDVGSGKLYTILSTDVYSLAILGRFRLLTETLAGWMRVKTDIVGR